MKKFLFILLFSILTVFLLSGCADDNSGGNQVVEGDTGNGDSNNNGSAGDDTENGGTSSGGAGNNPDDDPNDNPSEDVLINPTLTNLKSLQGTYDIEFFYTDGAKYAVIATDCSKVSEYAGESAVACKNADDKLEHYGQATIKVNEDSSVKVMSKVQMNGPAFSSGIVASMAGDKVYNFTEFPTIPASAITINQLNDNSTSNQVTGTCGRSATKIVCNDKSKSSPFYFTVEQDGTVVNNLVDKSVVPANTIIRMKKVSNTVIEFNPNEKYDNPEITNFDTNITYELQNN